MSLSIKLKLLLQLTLRSQSVAINTGEEVAAGGKPEHYGEKSD